MQAKRATKKLSQRDKELLGSLPEYAKPASPIGEAWEIIKSDFSLEPMKDLLGRS